MPEYVRQAPRHLERKEQRWASADEGSLIDELSCPSMQPSPFLRQAKLCVRLALNVLSVPSLLLPAVYASTAPARVHPQVGMGASTMHLVVPARVV